MSIQAVVKADAMGISTNCNLNLEHSIASLKDRFYAMTGFEPSSMHIKINGKDVTDESALLKTFTEGSETATIEITGKCEFGDLGDVDSVPKYELADNKYDKMEGTVRDMKRKAGLLNKGRYSEEPKDMKVGDRCEVEMADKSRHTGEIRFIGILDEGKGYWIGIKLDEAAGKNDGTHAGKRIFDCEEKHGVFVRAPKVHVGDYPVAGKQQEDEM